MGICTTKYSYCYGRVLPFDPAVISLSHFEIQRTIGLGGFGQVKSHENIRLMQP